MDCSTSNKSANLEHQEDGAISGNDVEQINKATTSGSSDPREEGEHELQKQAQQPSPCMLITSTMVVNKGKRTKRQRLHSPCPIRSSTYNHQEDHLVDEDDQEQLDLANCLILLAQGQPRPSSSYYSPPPLIPRNLSGQLGGNMRRHRGPAIPLNPSGAQTIAALSLCTAIIDADGKDDRISNNNNNNNCNGFLSLDQNLPASPSPEDTKFSLPPKQQILSTASLARNLIPAYCN